MERVGKRYCRGKKRTGEGKNEDIQWRRVGGMVRLGMKRKRLYQTQYSIDKEEGKGM